MFIKLIIDKNIILIISKNRFNFKQSIFKEFIIKKYSIGKHIL